MFKGKNYVTKYRPQRLIYCHHILSPVLIEIFLRLNILIYMLSSKCGSGRTGSVFELRGFHFTTKRRYVE